MSQTQTRPIDARDTTAPYRPEDDLTVEQRRDAYRKCLRIVEYTTGGLQRPLVPDHSVRRQLVASGLAISTAKNVIGSALENGDLFAWRDTDGTRYLGTDDVDALRGTVVSHVERHHTLERTPDKRLVAVANQRVAHLKREVGGDGGAP